MNWAVLQKEWGAVTFVLTVVVGMIIVPLALYFTHVGPGAIATPNIPTASSARASSAQVATDTRLPASPTPSSSP